MLVLRRMDVKLAKNRMKTYDNLDAVLTDALMEEDDGVKGYMAKGGHCATIVR